MVARAEEDFWDEFGNRLLFSGQRWDIKVDRWTETLAEERR